MLEGTNSIRLVGTVSERPSFDHSVYGESFCRMKLRAARLSGTEDVIPVTVSERLVSGRSLEEGDLVEITGQIRSYNQRTEDGSHLIITVFAREIYSLEPDNGVPDRNEAELFGHVCKPVVYRMTPFSREITDLILAVNRRYLKSDYIPAIAWGRNARFARELVPGDAVLIKGRLQSRIYQKKLPDGAEASRTAYELSCSSIEKADK